MKALLTKLFGKYLENKADLYEGTPGEGKAWWKSKTVLAGVYVFLRGLYIGVSSILVSAGRSPLPDYPDALDGIIGAILGGAVIHGRVNASQPIVIDEKKPPTDQT